MSAALALVVAQMPAAAATQDYAKYSQEAQDEALAEIAISRLGVLVSMRDGIGLSTDVYTPKNTHGPLPTILWKTP